MSHLGTLPFSTRKWVIKAMFQTSQFLKSIYFESKGTKEMWRFFRQIIKKGEITAWQWSQAVCTEQPHMGLRDRNCKNFRPTAWKQQGYHLKRFPPRMLKAWRAQILILEALMDCVADVTASPVLLVCQDTKSYWRFHTARKSQHALIAMPRLWEQLILRRHSVLQSHISSAAQTSHDVNNTSTYARNPLESIT